MDLRGPRRLRKWHVWLTVGLAILIGIALSETSAGAAVPNTSTQALTLDFGDFESAAELAYPSDGNGPFPTVILIPGSGPEDMNATIFSSYEMGPDGPILLSHIFGDITHYLSAHGTAVLHYDKHYVTGPGQVDYERFYANLDLPQMLADAEVVLEAAKANPLVDPNRIFLYGWSEGSTIAAELAVRHPEIAGLIVHGPVALSWRDTFVYQALEVGLPYLERFTDSGQVTADTLLAAYYGDGGMVAKGILSYVQDASFFMTGESAVNSLLDTNGDGVLDLDRELTPEALTRLIDDAFTPPGFFSMYAPEKALPSVIEQADALQLPVLILQGERDANVPPDGARKLAAALKESGNGDVTLQLYSDLGHSLGPASSLIDDNFQPIADAPMADLDAWIKDHARG